MFYAGEQRLLQIWIDWIIEETSGAFLSKEAVVIFAAEGEAAVILLRLLLIALTEEGSPL